MPSGDFRAGLLLHLVWGRRPFLVLPPSAVKFLDAAGAIDKLLFARVERVAGGADFDGDLFLGGTGCEAVSATAGDRCVDVFRMDVGFHDWLRGRRS